jgi:hypothetical protein
VKILAMVIFYGEIEMLAMKLLLEILFSIIIFFYFIFFTSRIEYQRTDKNENKCIQINFSTRPVFSNFR